MDREVIRAKKRHAVERAAEDALSGARGIDEARLAVGRARAGRTRQGAQQLGYMGRLDLVIFIDEDEVVPARGIEPRVRGAWSIQWAFSNSHDRNIARR